MICYRVDATATGSLVSWQGTMLYYQCCCRFFGGTSVPIIGCNFTMMMWQHTNNIATTTQFPAAPCTMSHHGTQLLDAALCLLVTLFTSSHGDAKTTSLAPPNVSTWAADTNTTVTDAG